MNSTLTVAQQVANAARHFQEKNTGRIPAAVIVVLSDDTLVITMQDALSPAEKALAQTTEGAAQVQDFHRKLFSSAMESLRQEITRITGIAVREAAVEVEPATGAIVHAFTTGTMVQVFQMADRMTQAAWNSSPQTNEERETRVEHSVLEMTEDGPAEHRGHRMYE